jgi:hypothetical protein
MELNSYFAFIVLIFGLKSLVTTNTLTNASKVVLVGLIVTVYGGLLGYFTYISMPPNLYKLSQEAYSPLGVSRSTTVEEARSCYRKLSIQLSPDKNSSPDAAQQFIAMQEIYAVLSNPTSRAAYEAYGTGHVISSDAGTFYFVWMMLVYGMTCSPRTEYGGRLLLLTYILVGLSEFEAKTTLSNDPPYGPWDIAVFEWFDLLRAVFPAAAAVLMSLNEWKYYSREAQSEQDLEK